MGEGSLGVIPVGGILPFCREWPVTKEPAALCIALVSVDTVAPNQSLV